MSESSSSKTLDVHALFVAEESRMLHFAMRHCDGDFAAAQDLVQDAFLQLLTHRDSVTKPRAWLFTTIRNLALNRRRKNARLDFVDPAACASADDAAAMPHDKFASDEAVSLVWLCVNELPPNDRLLVNLKFERGLSYAAIAEISGLTASNVGFRLHSIVKRLTEEYSRAERDGVAVLPA